MAQQNKKIKLGKKGINYITSIVDNTQCNFNPILQENDIGLDGQIEIFDIQGEPTGDIVFVQVKTGTSYYDIQKKKCYFPIGSHRDYWNKLKFPIIGIVCTMYEDSEEVKTAYWVDIKEYLERNDESVSNIIFEMGKSNEFNALTIRKYFIPLLCHELPQISFDEVKTLLEGSRIDKEIAIQLLCIKFSANVDSWKILFSLYRKEAEEIDLCFFYNALSYAFSHYDHFYVKGYYELSEEAKQFILCQIKQFNLVDITKMLALIKNNFIDRGTIGQSIEILIQNIDNSNQKLLEIILSNDVSENIRTCAELILAYHDSLFYSNNIKKIKLVNSEYTSMILNYIKDFGEFDLY